MMPVSNRIPAKTAVWVILLFSVVIGVMNIASAHSSYSVTVLIANAPLKGSLEYAALVEIAGSPPTRTLELTKCEIWNVPANKVGALEEAATAQGATVTRLGDDWKSMFRPMAAGAGMTQSQSQLMKEATESTAAAGAIVMDSPKSNVFEYALTKGMFSNDGDGDGAPSQIMIPLRDNLTVTAHRSSITRSKEGFIWRGVIGNAQNIATLIWQPTGRITGTVRYDGRIFVVKHLGGRRHCVVEIVPNLLPPEHAGMSATMKKKMNMAIDPLVKHGDASMLPQTPEQALLPKTNKQDAEVEKIDPNNVTITLLVAYTRSAASRYTDIEHDLIDLVIEEANQSFRSSGVNNVTLKLVHSFETDYMETGSYFDHLYDLLIPGNGKLKAVHALRNSHRADVALLIIHDPQGCGLAAKVRADESRAFAVVHHECAATSYSLAHEIGHIIGARHDTALDDSNDPYPYGHGFINGSKWRTMMSYKDDCNDCPRVPNWSNPDTRIDGVRAGDATSNNARVIREQAARVAAFR